MPSAEREIAVLASAAAAAVASSVANVASSVMIDEHPGKLTHCDAPLPLCAADAALAALWRAAVAVGASEEEEDATPAPVRAAVPVWVYSLGRCPSQQRHRHRYPSQFYLPHM